MEEVRSGEERLSSAWCPRGRIDGAPEEDIPGEGAIVFRFRSQVRCRDGSLASSHHWARQIGALGHEVRLIAPIYVKPFVKRNKNDAADAEAIAEAASRPTMRFVAVKSAEKQASGMAFKTRDLLVRQRTQAINALRGHMAEYGVVAPNGPVHIDRLAEALQDDGGLPAPVVALSQMLLAHIAALSEQIGLLDQELRERASRSNRQTADDNS
jgi:transposase